MKTYNIKKLIKGYLIKPSLKGMVLVAVPYKSPLEVRFNGKKMIIDSNTPLLHTQEFEDKFGRGHYNLYYYEWIENNKKIQTSLWS